MSIKFTAEDLAALDAAFRGFCKDQGGCLGFVSNDPRAGQAAYLAGPGRQVLDGPWTTAPLAELISSGPTVAAPHSQLDSLLVWPDIHIDE